MYKIGDNIIIGKNTKGVITNIISYGEATDDNLINVYIEIDDKEPLFPYFFIRLDPEKESKYKILLYQYLEAKGMCKHYKDAIEPTSYSPSADYAILKYFKDDMESCIKEVAHMKNISEDEAKLLLDSEVI